MSTQSQPASEQRAVTHPASEHPDRTRPAARLNARGFIPWGVVLLAPVLGIVLLRAPLLEQLTYLDPWLYSGYGWTLAHHVSIFGWPYYVDRFTVVLPIAASTKLLGPVPAYFVLHYALMAGCGAVLYLAVRRFASAAVAGAAVCLLMLNPFFVRLMLWDYTPFVMLPCTIAGASFWYLGSTPSRKLWSALGAGICLSAAIYANVVAALVLPALIGVEAVAAFRNGRRDVIMLVLRACAMVAGALLVLVVGYLGYRAILGSFPLKLMFQATIDFIRHNSVYAAQYRVAPSIFLHADPNIYAPVLVSVGTVIVLGRSLLSNTLRARMAQFAIAYTLVFWVFRFLASFYVVEVWWYYNLTAATAAFAMPAILDELGRRSDRPRWLVITGVAVAATGLIEIVIRTRVPAALAVFDYVRAHIVILACVLVTSCIAALLMVRLKRDSRRLIALAFFCGVAAATTLAPDGSNGSGEFSVTRTTAELHGYQAGYDMTQLIAKYDYPSSRVLLWDDLKGLGAAGWVNLSAHIGSYNPPAIPHLTASELEMLRNPTTTRVLAVSESLPQIAGAVPALKKAALRPRLETKGVWTGGRLYYALIKLHTSTG